MDTNGVADLEDYLQLRDDRPAKFTAAQVLYTLNTRDRRPCADCVHYYINPRRNRRVCEIFRPPNNDNVAAAGSCKFWTPDGELFPKL